MNGPAPIEELDLTKRALERTDLVGRDRPLVMRGLVRHWPIVQAAMRSDTEFARSLAGFDNDTSVDVLLMAPEEDGVIGYNDAMDAFNYEHHRVSVTQGMQRLAAYSRQSGPSPGLAIQSALIADCLPEFLREHTLAFMDASIGPRIWIGNHVTTPAHFDESHNIACVIAGARRFTLFAPDQARNLYIGPLDFAPTGAAMSMARLDRPDDPRYPRLKQALANAHSSELAPGDGIYIPPMWWHHVASLKRINALVNYWWKPVPADGHAPETGLGGLLHCILAFRSLGVSERKAWRGLLDYYVFGDEDPAAHIPEARRGMLGPMTPEQAAQLRKAIKRYLQD